MSPDSETLAYRVGELEADVKSLSKKVDRVTAVLMTLTVTIAASAIVFALSVVSLGGQGP